MKFYPSLMCIDFDNITNEIKNLNNSGITGYHIDIMDGNCVPNFALGINDIKAISKLSNLELDVHLMGIYPEKQIYSFINLPIHRLSFHFEFAYNHKEVINVLKSKNIKAGLVVNPETNLVEFSHLLEEIDFLTVMTVNPGFAGQKFIDSVTEKLKLILDYRQKNNLNFTIQVDGAISKDKVNFLSSLGVEEFVLGTAGLFNSKLPTYKESIEFLKI